MCFFSLSLTGLVALLRLKTGQVLFFDGKSRAVDSFAGSWAVVRNECFFFKDEGGGDFFTLHFQVFDSFFLSFPCSSNFKNRTLLILQAGRVWTPNALEKPNLVWLQVECFNPYAP